MLLKLLDSSAQEIFRKEKKKKKKRNVYCRKFQEVHKICTSLLLSKNIFSLCPPTHILLSLCDYNNNILEYDQTGDPLCTDIDLLFGIFLKQ